MTGINDDDDDAAAGSPPYALTDAAKLGVTTMEDAEIVLRDCRELPPYALTDQHAAALERAIRAEGYSILVNVDTGDVKLVKDV
jgi:hypothetical protein